LKEWSAAAQNHKDDSANEEAEQRMMFFNGQALFLC
jgi:hypothetical protein